jgi:phenylalanyl-tRNA synthetase alpha chain
MDELLQQIEKYKKEIDQFSAGNGKTVEEFRIKWLGTKGIVKNLMGEIKNVPNEKKKEFGQVMNDFKLFVEEKFEKLRTQAAGSQLLT